MTENKEDGGEDVIPDRSDLIEHAEDNVHHEAEIQQSSAASRQVSNLQGEGTPAVNVRSRPYRRQDEQRDAMQSLWRVGWAKDRREGEAYVQSDVCCRGEKCESEECVWLERVYGCV